MTNTGLLREKIDASGYKLAFVASQCNLSYQGFLKKMKGQTEFKVNEVQVLKELLDLSNQEASEIFFA